MFSRLDYWLISRDAICLVYSTDIRPALKYDHNAISLKLKVSENKRGKGYWKLNNSLLNDITYLNEIKEVIRSVNYEFSYLDQQMKWEMCKIRIKDFSMKYVKQVYMNKRKYISLKQIIKLLVKQLRLRSVQITSKKCKN